MNVTFDWNEWFMIIAAFIFFSFFLFIRKYFPLVIVIIIWVFADVFVASTDYFLLATPFKLYYFGDNPSYEASGALFHLIIYPTGCLIFLYAYDKWKLYGRKTFWFLLLWTGFGVFFEWLCLKNHVLVYTGWKLYYSIPTYPAAALLLIFLFRFSKKKLQELSVEELSKT